MLSWHSPDPYIQYINFHQIPAYETVNITQSNLFYPYEDFRDGQIHLFSRGKGKTGTIHQTIPVQRPLLPCGTGSVSEKLFLTVPILWPAFWLPSP